MPPSSPPPHKPNTEWDTPRRKEIRSDHYDHFMTYDAIAEARNILKITVFDICHVISSRRSVYNPDIQENRGKKSKITAKDVRQIELILEEDGFYARNLT